jgi:hypothetical protein
MLFFIMPKGNLSGFTYDKQSIIILAAAALIMVLFSFRFASINKTGSKPTKKPVASCQINNFSGLFDSSEKTALFEGKGIDIPYLALEYNNPQNVLGLAQEERFIEVDLAEQMLYAWEGNRLFMETKISSGLPATPTPTGEFRIWIKLRAAKMSGGTGRNYYYLPNVPYIMFFYNDQTPKHIGYGLHGTYWHDDFGNPRSHGCVNLPTSIAKEIFEWAGPTLPAGKSVVYASEENPGSRIIIR